MTGMLRTTLCFLFGLMLLCSSCVCESDQQAAIRDFCEHMVEQYPQANLQDVYKSCYQDYFGAEHLIADSAAARRYLSSELAACKGQDLSALPAAEPTGFRQRFVRINLAQVLIGEMSENELLERFIAAAEQYGPYGDDWAAEWQEIEAVALAVHPAWADEALQAALQQAAHQQAPVHHSAAYKQAYHPHYRIIQNPNK